MAKLYLYTCFHANLDFSSIPQEHYSRIVDRCFWPVVDFLHKYPRIRLGLEFPANTLETINKEDPTFIRTLADYWDKDRCEIIGSGYCQTIFPLVPAEVNARNLALGNERYRKLLGRLPVTAYVNEQTCSSGILKLYLDAGYKNIIIDWENTTVYHCYPESYRYGTQWAKAQDGTKLTVVWNSTVSFQKLQRFVQSEIALDEYFNYIRSHLSEIEDRALPLYGSDWEIFDYRPGSAEIIYTKNAGQEMKRLESLFSHLSSDQRFEVTTPSEVAKVFPPVNEIRLESTEYPVPCKKQEKYNVTRWALCGRDNIRLNTQCYHLYDDIRQIESLVHFVDEASGKTIELWKDLIYLWGSDFRTHTNDEKYLIFRNGMGAAQNKAREAIGGLLKTVKVEDDFALFNPGEAEWNETPFEFLMHFGPGEIRGHIQILLNGRETRTQEESVEYYRDGSVRKATIIICPTIGPHFVMQGRVVAMPRIKVAEDKVDIGSNFIETSQAKCSFIATRGAAIRELCFPLISDQSLVRTLPHGYFKNIKMAADFYSANMIALTRSGGEKITDLNKTELIVPDDGERFPIRIPVVCRIPSQLGEIWKTFYVYRTHPRVDIQYHFSLRDFKPFSFRLGILTINPEAFDGDSLRYRTVNGGYAVETFPLKGKKVAQDEPVSLMVSAHHCLGATEGWVDISDRDKGVAVITRKSQLYSVPLMHYEELDGTYFLRAYTSIGETDDTCDLSWRFNDKVRVTFLGHHNDLNKLRQESANINRGLVVIQRANRGD